MNCCSPLPDSITVGNMLYSHLIAITTVSTANYIISTILHLAYSLSWGDDISSDVAPSPPTRHHSPIPHDVFAARRHAYDMYSSHRYLLYFGCELCKSIKNPQEITYDVGNCNYKRASYAHLIVRIPPGLGVTISPYRHPDFATVEGWITTNVYNSLGEMYWFSLLLFHKSFFTRYH